MAYQLQFHYDINNINKNKGDTMRIRNLSIKAFIFAISAAALIGFFGSSMASGQLITYHLCHGTAKYMRGGSWQNAVNATVVVKLTANPSQIYRTVTDQNGHFDVWLLAPVPTYPFTDGNYTCNISLQTYSTDSPFYYSSNLAGLNGVNLGVVYLKNGLPD